MDSEGFKLGVCRLTLCSLASSAFASSSRDWRLSRLIRESARAEDIWSRSLVIACGDQAIQT
eukprot:scaffold173520_cov18-Prasinocladus_malaysianus.AAC.1